jgi:hypothetical protein
VVLGEKKRNSQEGGKKWVNTLQRINIVDPIHLRFPPVRWAWRPAESEQLK